MLVNVILKNVSNSPVTLAAHGDYELAVGAEVNLCDPDLPDHYEDWMAAERAMRAAELPETLRWGVRPVRQGRT